MKSCLKAASRNVSGVSRIRSEGGSMNALEEFRSMIEKHWPHSNPYWREGEMKFAPTIDAIADRIEAEYTPNSEIAAKYMELPKDADGVPCKIGDLMETDEHVPRKVVGYYLAYPDYPCVTLEFVSPSVESYKLHHVKQPKQLTKEDIDALAASTKFEKVFGCGMYCYDCPSMIEGKKPREYYGTDYCWQSVTQHILRLERERVAGEQK